MRIRISRSVAFIVTILAASSCVAPQVVRSIQVGYTQGTLSGGSMVDPDLQSISVSVNPFAGYGLEKTP